MKGDEPRSNQLHSWPLCCGSRRKVPLVSQLEISRPQGCVPRPSASRRTLHGTRWRKFGGSRDDGAWPRPSASRRPLTSPSERLPRHGIPTPAGAAHQHGQSASGSSSLTLGGRHVQTFSKVCTSLQSLRLGNILQTFCSLCFMKCTLSTDSLHTFSVDHLLSCTLFLYLQPFCRTYAHFLQRT